MSAATHVLLFRFKNRWIAASGGARGELIHHYESGDRHDAEAAARRWAQECGVELYAHE